MAIFNLEVKDLNRLLKFKDGYAPDNCRIPILCVNNIARKQLSGIYPATPQHLEWMRFCATNRLITNFKFDQAIHFVNSGGNYLFLCSFTCNVVYTRNGITNLNGFDGFLFML